MKRLFALMLALIMVLSLATTAFAATPTTGSVTNDTARTYNAYQIFSGTQAEDDEVLGEIVWGNGINAEDFLTALKPLTVNDSAPFADCTNAASVATVLQKESDKSAIAQAFANLAAKHLGTEYVNVPEKETVTMDSGYYLLIETSVPAPSTAKNPALLQVTNGTLTITDKSAAPTLEKKVDSADSADVNIGDTVTFTLTATLPSSFEGYDTYKVVFHDTMHKGLTYNQDAKIGEDSANPVVGKDDNGNTTLTITIDNVIGTYAAGETITVTYTATLNNDAVINAEGNFNKAYLEFSNDPNWNGSGDSDEEPTGTTPEDEVKVYTWDMGVLKYADGNKAKVLEGVKFILLNQEKNKIAQVAEGKIVSWDDFDETMDVQQYELSTDANGKISVSGLKSGIYYLRETQALPGYNKLTTDTEIKVEGKTDGTYKTAIAEVENNSGATLPETGGMGTTLFYVFGAILMVGAAVLLVTKKRMASAE